MASAGKNGSAGWTKSAQIERYPFNLTPRCPLVVNRNVSDEPQPRVRIDMHYELELGIVIHGRVFRGYENFEMVVEPGDVWLCSIWEPHACRTLQAPGARIVMTILPQMLTEMHTPEAPDFDWYGPFRLPPERRPRVQKSRRKEMLALAERFTQSLAMGDPERALWQRVLLMETLLLLRRPGEKFEPTGAEPRFTDRIGRAVEFVFNSYGLASAEKAAAHCGISRSRFDTLFQRTMGLSYARFALRYRLSGAAVQLLQTDDAMKSIAADWGFTDASHLNRAFAAHYGCTPGAYREANGRGGGK